MKRLLLPALVWLSVCAWSAGGAEPATEQFEKMVAPLLIRRCVDCHAGPAAKGGLDLTTAAGLKRGGKHGPAVTAGKLDESPLWERVEAGEMPPKHPLPEAEKKLLRDWIGAGAAWSGGALDPFRFTTVQRAGYDWWSLRPVTRPEPPVVKDAAWARTPVDRFVGARLEAQGWRPAPEADRRTLIRRLFFDLVGLPPSRDEVETFVRDPDPAAYEKLVERLLASPQHGERWARHWLDVVRFGESNGYEYDELRKNAWPYRDWVIAALNRDLPYDEFARMQLAGDALAADAADGIAATGFLVAGGYDTPGQRQQSVAMRAVVRQEELEDVLGTFGQTFLGLTVQCARCHDHKFDPVRQEDYYRLAASFAGVQHGERDLTPAAERQRSGRELDTPQRRLPLEVQRRLATGPARHLAYAVSPRPPEATHLLLRGEPARKGPLLAPGAVAALGGPAFDLAPDAPESARRVRLARWLTDRRNPLFARVMVNRVWQYHFGAGLVETPSDFGFSGGRPSHPELLDWLADEFARHGYSLRALHRLMVNSAAYRQSGLAAPGPLAQDASNRLLWRASPRRLEAESVRDAMLAVAGVLNPRMGGAGYQDFDVSVRGATYFYTPSDHDDPQLHRRSVYRTLARGGHNRLLDTLDCPDPSAVAPRRALTTTPLQALSLLNNPFALRMAERFAQRVRREAGNDPLAQVRWAYALALGVRRRRRRRRRLVRRWRRMA